MRDFAGIKDLFNREWVGDARDRRMTRNPAMHALFRAVAAKRPGKELIHHSARGRQPRSHASLKLLRQFGMQVSMSRQGHCWNNAPMESDWGSLKTEPAPLRRYATREQAKCAVSEYKRSLLNTRGD